MCDDHFARIFANFKHFPRDLLVLMDFRRDGIKLQDFLEFQKSVKTLFNV